MDNLQHGRPLLGLLLRLLAQQWANAVEQALAEAEFGDIRTGHANVFAFVPDQGMPISELAKRAKVRKQTMAQTVEQLERAGYVERRPNVRDKRAQLVFLTARGRSVRPIAVAAGHRVEQHWATLTSRHDIERLRELLQRLLRELSSHNP